MSVGDIVQFDWDQSGDRDHTGIVTKVTHDDGGTQVYFAGHTLDSDYRSVDTAITEDHPGGAVYYWHIVVLGRRAHENRPARWRPVLSPADTLGPCPRARPTRRRTRRIRRNRTIAVGVAVVVLRRRHRVPA